MAPYTKSAGSVDADVLLMLQDWSSSDFLSGPLDEDAIHYGHTPSLETNRNLKALLRDHLGLGLTQEGIQQEVRVEAGGAQEGTQQEVRVEAGGAQEGIQQEVRVEAGDAQGTAQGQVTRGGGGSGESYGCSATEKGACWCGCWGPGEHPP
ncbi:MAG: hypothetical protein R3F05_01835 [Planctomycetota bacterium]